MANTRPELLPEALFPLVAEFVLRLTKTPTERGFNLLYGMGGGMRNMVFLPRKWTQF